MTTNLLTTLQLEPLLEIGIVIIFDHEIIPP